MKGKLSLAVFALAIMASCAAAADWQGLQAPVFSGADRVIDGPWGDAYKVTVSYSVHPYKGGVIYGASASYASKDIFSTITAPSCERPVWKAGNKTIPTHGKMTRLSGIVIYLVDFGEKDFKRLTSSEAITLNWCGQVLPLTADEKKAISKLIAEAKDAVW